MIHRVTLTYNEWYTDNEWQQMKTNGTTSDSDWQRVVISAIFFRMIEERITKHHQENFLNLEEDTDEWLFN